MIFCFSTDSKRRKPQTQANDNGNKSSVIASVSGSTRKNSTNGNNILLFKLYYDTLMRFKSFHKRNQLALCIIKNNLKSVTLHNSLPPSLPPSPVSMSLSPLSLSSHLFRALFNPLNRIFWHSNTAQKRANGCVLESYKHSLHASDRYNESSISLFSLWPSQGCSHQVQWMLSQYRANINSNLRLLTRALHAWIKIHNGFILPWFNRAEIY